MFAASPPVPQLSAEALPLGLPDDIDAAAVILEAEDRRDLSDDLLRLSRAPEAAVRARAALAIGRIGLPIGYTRLVELLRDPDPPVRALAAFGLGLLELDLEPAIISATRARIAARLTPLLRDPEPVVVEQALWTLGIHADPMASPGVAAVLGDATRSPEVLEAALGAWWRLGGASPEPAEAHLRSSSAAVRKAAATALRRLRDPNALPALAGALQDPDAGVRAAAIRGVHEAPATVVRRHLITLLEDRDWRVVYAALGWAMALWRRDAEVDDEVFTAVLMASAHRDRSVQRLALEALASAPGKFTVPEDRLIVALRSGDATTRLAALEALGSSESTANDGLDDLRDVYGIDAPPREGNAAEIPEILMGSPLEAAAVVRALAAAGDGSADGWLRLLGEHGPEAARAEVLRQLRRIAPQEARLVAAALLQEGPPVLRAVAGEVIDELVLTGDMGAGGREVSWSDLLWTAQRELGEAGALEPRLILLDSLLSIDAETLRFRVSALLPDPDRVIRTWALRNLRPEAGSRAAELVPDALGPIDTGRTPADYRRLAAQIIALQQRPPRLEIQTPRGTLVWELQVAWAPMTALAYLDWVESGFFDGLGFHRVVPDFVIQAGDPTAVGYGGAHGSLRSEETPVSYSQGTVGLALAGRDTGGSQFFIVPSAQPHLTGLYPVLGRVVDGGRFIERIQPGDRLQIRVRAGDEGATDRSAPLRQTRLAPPPGSGKTRTQLGLPGYRGR